jgi:hypothetical protein
MKLKTLVTVCAEIAVLAIWGAVGLAAHRSLDEHEAKRKAQASADVAGPVALVKIDDKHVKE